MYIRALYILVWTLWRNFLWFALIIVKIQTRSRYIFHKVPRKCQHCLFELFFLLWFTAVFCMCTLNIKREALCDRATAPLVPVKEAFDVLLRTTRTNLNIEPTSRHYETARRVQLQWHSINWPFVHSKQF